MSATNCYFVTSHTAQGFVNFLPTNLKGLKVYRLKHPSLTLKTKVLQRLDQFYRNQLEAVERLVSGHSKNFLDGLINRGRSIAIISDHVLDDQASIEHSFELELAGPLKSLQEKQLSINNLFHEAYKYIYKSLKAHEEVEGYYIKEMDFNRSNEQINRIKDQLFAKEQLPKVTKPLIYKRLFGSNTVDGNYNIVSQILPSVDQRILLKGGPGTGKSFFMKEIVKTCLAKGYSVEQYMCSFDPNSIDMIIIPALNAGLLDSTGSHTFSPLCEKDIVIDLYQEAGTIDIEKAYQGELRMIQNRQQEYRQRAHQLIQTAGNKLYKLEKMFMSQADHSLINRQVLNIIRSLP